jgi:AraC family transcriptional regulator, regulatory protein of adaptative response / methylated-DNA-[protein]-cysteine methyltransferase
MKTNLTNSTGKEIRYAVGHASMGVLLLGATDKGICRVKIGETENTLLQEFKAEFSKARIERDDALSGWLKTVGDALEGRHDGIQSLPLDIRTTAFQRRVYEELKRIPAGETRTYSEIAERLGGASGRRAVARACATNNVAVVIPCHRVVRSDGGLGGYRWGLDRKKELLNKEKESK